MKTKKNTKLNKKTSKKNTTNLDYDNQVDNKFRATIYLGKNMTVVEEAVVISKDKNCLTYDDVEFNFYNIMDNKYPESDYPNANIEKIEVFSDGQNSKNWFPVFSESMKDKIAEAEKSNIYEKYLILPEATYSISPEYKLYLRMVETGLLPEDTPFDPEKFKLLVSNK